MTESSTEVDSAELDVKSSAEGSRSRNLRSSVIDPEVVEAAILIDLFASKYFIAYFLRLEVSLLSGRYALMKY